MKPSRTALATLSLAALLSMAAALPAKAQSLSVEQARAIVAPFYDALNAAPGRDAATLVLQATTPDWMSCSGSWLVSCCCPFGKNVNSSIFEAILL